MTMHSSNFLIRQIPVSKQDFSGNNDAFSVNPTVMQVKISEKGTISFSILKLLYPRLSNGKKLNLW